MKIVNLIFISAILITASTTQTSSVDPNDEPLVHDYLKIALWLILGMIVGVIFEAKIQIRDIVKPIAQKGVTGIIISASIYVLFKFASFVSAYL
jgi:uncharacterized membrane protein YfcA